MLNSTLKNANILIVDDQQANIDMLADLLEMLGYTSIKTTTDPRLVVDLFNEFNPDLILLDLMMPYLSGFDVMEQLKELIPDGTYFPILILTADVSSESKERALAGGAKDFLTKPFDLVEVSLRIKNLLETRYLHTQLQNQNLILEEKVKERTIELEKANQELKSLDQAKSEFLQIISHEINTPLNGIVGFIGILKEELKTSEFYKMFQYLEASANRLERFSRASLLITELKTRKRTITKEDTPVDYLIETTKKKLNEQIEAKGIRLNAEGEINRSSISIDRELIEFSFESILKNAVYYSPDGGEIKMKINTDVKQTTCSFIDQGKGFSPVAMKNLFNLFAPGEQHLDSNKGLDLALVKFIMDAHNGEIKISNNDEQGANVTLIFPNVKNLITIENYKVNEN